MEICLNTSLLIIIIVLFAALLYMINGGFFFFFFLSFFLSFFCLFQVMKYEKIDGQDAKIQTHRRQSDFR